MKQTLICFLCIAGIIACSETTRQPANSDGTTASAQNGQDSIGKNSSSVSDDKAITETIQNFYKWYATFILDTTQNIEYVNTEGKTAKLIMPQVNAYHAALLKSGYLSKIYIDNDLAFLKKNEAQWQIDGLDEPLAGLDYDRIYCNQDFDNSSYSNLIVTVETISADKARVRLMDGKDKSDLAQKLDLVKENGKWLIANILCE